MSLRSLVKKLIPVRLFRAIEPYGHWAEAVAAQIVYRFVARKLNVIGVTGTDGKTTTSLFIAELLRQNGYKTATMTTVTVDYGDGQGDQPSPIQHGQTTASVWQLLSILKTMRGNGAEWVVLETSSHALAQHRVWSLPFSIAVITNISHEHLDYHKTFERYKAAKRLLFKQTNRNRRGLRLGIINADDANAEYFAKAIKNTLFYGEKSGDLKASKIKLTPTGSRYIVKTDTKEYRINCHLPGNFNVYNSLAAVAVGKALGMSKKQIETGIDALKNVAGRMERLETDQPFDVIVDYAVTPEALKNVLQSTKGTTTGSVRLVFGATGDRDKLKRPVMGKVAATYADQVYLSDDETYTEDPEAIRDAVYEGVVEAGGQAKTRVIADRSEAINQAIADAQPGDCVLLTGFGHQQYRNTGGVKEPWSDSGEAKKALLQKQQ